MSIRNGNLKGQGKFQQAALARCYNTGLLQTEQQNQGNGIYITI